MVHLHQQHQTLLLKLLLWFDTTGYLWYSMAKNWMITSKAKDSMNMNPRGSMYMYCPVYCRLMSIFGTWIKTVDPKSWRTTVAVSQKALQMKKTKVICTWRWKRLILLEVYFVICLITLKHIMHKQNHKRATQFTTMTHRYLVSQLLEFISHFFLLLFAVRQRLQVFNYQFSEELLFILQRNTETFSMTCISCCQNCNYERVCFTLNIFTKMHKYHCDLPLLWKSI